MATQTQYTFDDSYRKAVFFNRFSNISLHKLAMKIHTDRGSAVLVAYRFYPDDRYSKSDAIASIVKAWDIVEPFKMHYEKITANTLHGAKHVFDLDSETDKLLLIAWLHEHAVLL